MYFCRVVKSDVLPPVRTLTEAARAGLRNVIVAHLDDKNGRAKHRPGMPQSGYYSDAAESAEEYFQKIAEGRITPQSYDAAPGEQTGGSCAVVIQNSRDRVNAHKLEGL